jgi:FecR protein
MLSKTVTRHVMAMVLILAAGSSARAADDGVWSVSKSSGEVWVATSGTEQVALKQEEALKPGDTIRTGRNGRVLLVRGEESILISPNSVIGVPAEKKDGMSTTILQQAGSILLEVEKRNVKHFEVETPYLAAVVKGTQFSVTVDGASTRVDVRRGQVEVSDFKSGQIALVLPGQAATSLEHGKAGLSLSGTGTFNPIEQGKPRPSSIDRIPVPKGGLPAPRNAGDGKIIHALAHTGTSIAKLSTAPARQQAAGESGAKRNVIHISNALGEVRLNVHKATNGLAHGAATTNGGRSASHDLAATNTSIWGGDRKSGSSTASAAGQTGGNGGNGGNGANGGNGGGGGNSGSSGGTGAASGGVGSSVAAVTSGVAGTAAGLTGTVGDVVAGTGGVVNGAVGNGRNLVNGVVGGVAGGVGSILGRRH